MFWIISVYFNIRNTLPKTGTFLLGHLYMNLETRLRGRPRNRWQDEVRDNERLVGGKGWMERVYKTGKEEASENSKESSHSAHANGMNELPVTDTIIVFH